MLPHSTIAVFLGNIFFSLLDIEIELEVVSLSFSVMVSFA